MGLVGQAVCARAGKALTAANALPIWSAVRRLGCGVMNKGDASLKWFVYLLYGRMRPLWVHSFNRYGQKQ